jgi:hypothetical protein
MNGSGWPPRPGHSHLPYSEGVRLSAVLLDAALPFSARRGPNVVLGRQLRGARVRLFVHGRSLMRGNADQVARRGKAAVLRPFLGVESADQSLTSAGVGPTANVGAHAARRSRVPRAASQSQVRVTVQRSRLIVMGGNRDSRTANHIRIAERFLTNKTSQSGRDSY